MTTAEQATAESMAPAGAEIGNWVRRYATATRSHRWKPLADR